MRVEIEGSESNLNIEPAYVKYSNIAVNGKILEKAPLYKLTVYLDFSFIHVCRVPWQSCVIPGESLETVTVAAT